MHLKKVKGILSSSNGMNLYRGCTHGCIYCDSRSKCYHMEHAFEDVEVKENAIVLLENALKRKRLKCMLSTGSMTDPYIPLEDEFSSVRKALSLAYKYGFGFTLITKSNRVLKDLDLLKAINDKTKCVVQMTLTTYDEDLCKKIEPNVISSTRRFEVIRKLRENGIYTGVLMTPVLPFLTDTEDNILNMIVKSKEVDAKFIYTRMGMTLKTNQKDYYYKALDILYPGLKEDYMAVYGKKNICNTLQFRHLMELFLKKCSENHILTDMDAIIADYKKEIPQNEQMSLF